MHQDQDPGLGINTAYCSCGGSKFPQSFATVSGTVTSCAYTTMPKATFNPISSLPSRTPTSPKSTSTSRAAPYSPTGSQGANQRNKCHIHVWEFWGCGPDEHNLEAVLQLWDAAGAWIPVETAKVRIDAEYPGSWTSKLENAVVVTGEHRGDYVQFAVGGTKWTSSDTDQTLDAWCSTGDWDPRGGPVCPDGTPFTQDGAGLVCTCSPSPHSDFLAGLLADGLSQSTRQMDCYFPCPFKGGPSSDGLQGQPSR